MLARVSAEAGPAAKIVDARKIRTGGVGGFFAREHFEVRVELPDGTVPAADALAAEPPASLLDLADLVDEQEADVTRHAIGRIPVSQVTATVARRAFEESMSAAAAGDRRATAAAPAPPRPLPEQVLEPTEVPRMPLPTTEGDAFQSVLRTLVSELDVPAPTPTPPTASFERLTAEELSTPARPLPSNELDLLGIDVADGAGEVLGDDDHDLLPEPTGDTSPVARDVSLPAPAGDLTTAILRALEQPALPPEAGPHATIAVVGQGWSALQVATTIARHVVGPDVDLDGAWEHERPLHVLFPVGDDAYDTTWTGPTVVAIDAPMGKADRSWAAEVLDVLDPDLVWGVVDATRKNDDITEWCVELGGVDVLAVENLDATCSPAAVLELGLPIGLIDRRPATKLAWATLLAERVELSA